MTIRSSPKLEKRIRITVSPTGRRSVDADDMFNVPSARARLEKAHRLATALGLKTRAGGTTHPTVSPDL